MRTCVGLLVIALVATILAPGVLAQSRDTVIVGLLGEPDSVVPAFVRAAVETHVGSTLFVPLVGLNGEGGAIPRLAAQVPTLENGLWRLLPNNEMELTYTLRPGFKWHDGTPVTAGDLVFAWEVSREPRAGAAAVDRSLTGVSAPNATTVVVRWSERRVAANLEQLFGLPRHLLEAPFRENPASVRTGAYASKPVGNGPYTLIEWVRGRHIRLQAFDDYPEGKPAIRNLIFRFFPSAAAVGSEEVHANFTGAGGGPEFAPVTIPSLIFEHVAFNLDSPLLRDRRVRQALLHATDRDAVRRDAWRAVDELAHTWIPPRHPLHHTGVRRYQPDRAAAQRLFAEAGWRPGPDGVLRNQAGERFELVFMTTPGNARRERAQDLLIAQWQAVGVAVRKENPANFFDMLERREFQHLGMFAWIVSPISTGRDIWHSSQIPAQSNQFQGNNVYGWRHAENDRLLDQANQELSDARRSEPMRRQQEIWADEVPAMPLWYRNEEAFVHRNLRGVRPIQLPGGYTWNVHQWTWAP
ncbi:MAG: peptide ABC transporter substrate-binding protein [bacterium]